MTSDLKTIQIQSESFEISVPYSEGHTLTAIEAKVLNQTRCENIRNNQSKAIREAKEDGTFDLKTATKAVKEYDAKYSFAMPGAGAIRRSLDPVEKEARAIARSVLTQKLKDQGKKMKDQDKEKIANIIEKWAENPKVIAAAKKTVADRAALAEMSLEDA